MCCSDRCSVAAFVLGVRALGIGDWDVISAGTPAAFAYALVIEAKAQCRLADEYDAAQERGEVQPHGGQGKRDVPKENIPPTVKDLGLTRKQIFNARQVRDAETKEPGITRKTVDAQLKTGREPIRAHGFQVHAQVQQRLPALVAHAATSPA
jgi:hypothetical protein